MRISSPRACRLGLAVVVVLGSAIAGAGPATADASKAEITTVIGGLNSPRAVAFDGHGDLYVVSVGRGRHRQ